MEKFKGDIADRFFWKKGTKTGGTYSTAAEADGHVDRSTSVLLPAVTVRDAQNHFRLQMYGEQNLHALRREINRALVAYRQGVKSAKTEK